MEQLTLFPELQVGGLTGTHLFSVHALVIGK